jgi:hypothetical protein
MVAFFNVTNVLAQALSYAVACLNSTWHLHHLPFRSNANASADAHQWPSQATEI